MKRRLQRALDRYSTNEIVDALVQRGDVWTWQEETADRDPSNPSARGYRTLFEIQHRESAPGDSQ